MGPVMSPTLAQGRLLTAGRGEGWPLAGMGQSPYPQAWPCCILCDFTRSPLQRSAFSCTSEGFDKTGDFQTSSSLVAESLLLY